MHGGGGDVLSADLSGVYRAWCHVVSLVFCFERTIEGGGGGGGGFGSPSGGGGGGYMAEGAVDSPAGGGGSGGQRSKEKTVPPLG